MTADFGQSLPTARFKVNNKDNKTMPIDVAL